jgi:hypothetical protein
VQCVSQKFHLKAVVAIMRYLKRIGARPSVQLPAASLLCGRDMVSSAELANAKTTSSGCKGCIGNQNVEKMGLDYLQLDLLSKFALAL